MYRPVLDERAGSDFDIFSTHSHAAIIYNAVPEGPFFHSMKSNFTSRETSSVFAFLTAEEKRPLGVVKQLYFVS